MKDLSAKCVWANVQVRVIGLFFTMTSSSSHHTSIFEKNDECIEAARHLKRRTQAPFILGNVSSSDESDMEIVEHYSQNSTKRIRLKKSKIHGSHRILVSNSAQNVPVSAQDLPSYREDLLLYYPAAPNVEVRKEECDKRYLHWFTTKTNESLTERYVFCAAVSNSSF